MTASPGRSEAEREEMTCGHGKHVAGCQACDEDAQRFISYRLGSNWLADRDRRIEQAAEARALREFADAWAERPETSSAEMYADACARADRLEDR